MATVMVVRSRIYYLLGMIDDVIVHGQRTEGLVDNFRSVFKRFRKLNIKVNPDKYKLGLNKIEYVSHTVDEIGKSFSREKIEEVLAT